MKKVMNLKNSLLFLILFSLLLAGRFFFLEPPVEKIIASMNVEDQKDLGFFFQYLVHDAHFGYVIFGDKPISIAGYFIREPAEHVLSGYIPHIVIDRLWKVWKKHEHKFKFKKYLLLNEQGSLKSNNHRIITIINKKAFLETVRENLVDFQKVLGKNMTPERLLKSLSNPNANLFEALHRNEILYGILLGYGKENAIFYEQRFILMRLADPAYVFFPVTESPYESYSIKLPKISPQFGSLKKEYEHVQQQCEFFDLDFKLSRFQSPHFIAIKNSSKTLTLKQKYRKLHRELIKRCAQGDFLTITLEQLCSQEKSTRNDR